MRNQKDIDRKLFHLYNMMKENISGGSLNLTGNINRYTVGAKELFNCKVDYFHQDPQHYLKRIEEELKSNYLFYEFPVNFDTLGYWVSDTGYLFVDLGFRMSDLNDALKWASFNGEIAIWDNLHGKEINVNQFLYPRR